MPSMKGIGDGKKADCVINHITKPDGTRAEQTGTDMGNGKIAGDVCLPSSAQIFPTLAVDTAIYAIGDVVGGKLTLTDANHSTTMAKSDGTGILQSLFVMDRSGTQKPQLEILIFNADPTASTLNDQGAISIHANDVPKIIRRLTVLPSDYVLLGGMYIADLSPGGKVLKAIGSANLYAVIVASGTPDFVASTDLRVGFGILRD